MRGPGPSSSRRRLSAMRQKNESGGKKKGGRGVGASPGQQSCKSFSCWLWWRPALPSHGRSKPDCRGRAADQDLQPCSLHHGLARPGHTGVVHRCGCPHRALLGGALVALSVATPTPCLISFHLVRSLPFGTMLPPPPPCTLLMCAWGTWGYMGAQLRVVILNDSSCCGGDDERLEGSGGVAPLCSPRAE